MADRYIDQALDGFTSGLSKKLDPLHKGSGYNMRMYTRDRVYDPTNSL